MNTPMISIIIPVYKVESYLNRCIQSVVDQTYTNLEIILINDGSPDKCPLVCDSWANKDSRISVIHTENYGVSHARNLGLDAAKGEFIGFVDADDWIDSDMYEQMINGMLREDIDICVGGRLLEIESKQLINPKRGQVDFQYGSPQILSRESALKESYSSSDNKLFDAILCDKLFKRKLFGDIRFEERISYGEDVLIFWQLMKNVKQILYLPLHKYHYLMREGSAIHQRLNPRFLDRFEAFSRIKQTSLDESDELKKILNIPYTTHLVYSMRIMLILDEKKYKNRILESQSYIRTHIINCLMMKIYPFSFRIKFIIGALFFCLPFEICSLMKPWIRLRND